MEVVSREKTTAKDSHVLAISIFNQGIVKNDRLVSNRIFYTAIHSNRFFKSL